MHSSLRVPVAHCSKSSAYPTILKERGGAILAIVEHQFVTAIQATGVIPADVLTNGLALVGRIGKLGYNTTV